MMEGKWHSHRVAGVPAIILLEGKAKVPHVFSFVCDQCYWDSYSSIFH